MEREGRECDWREKAGNVSGERRQGMSLEREGRECDWREKARGRTNSKPYRRVWERDQEDWNVMGWPGNETWKHGDETRRM